MEKKVSSKSVVIPHQPYPTNGTRIEFCSSQHYTAAWDKKEHEPLLRPKPFSYKKQQNCYKDQQQIAASPHPLPPPSIPQYTCLQYNPPNQPNSPNKAQNQTKNKGKSNTITQLTNKFRIPSPHNKEN